METKKKKKNNIDLGAIIRQLIGRKKLILTNMLIAAVVFSALILSVPKYYTCEVKLAPEFDDGASAGSLGSIAATFGINLGSGVNNDAISPSLYPDLMESTDFVVSLFSTQVKTLDGSVQTDYRTYLQKYQQKAWWTIAMNWTKNTCKKMFGAKPKDKTALKDIDPFLLSEDDSRMVERITKKITCSVDRKNYVITIMVKDQDPLVCANMADSVRVKLQKFITNYRTSKARVDLEYYQKLQQEAQAEYKKALSAYSAYADTHHDMILQSYISERDQLENDMQAKFSTLTAVNQQLEVSKAKVQEFTPAFTILKNATVPVKPTGPKRASFVVAMMFLVFLVTSWYIIKGKKVAALFKKQPQAPLD